MILQKIQTKGHLISKCLFGVINFFQKTNENKSTRSKVEFVCSFFGRNVGLKKIISNLSDLWYSTFYLRHYDAFSDMFEQVWAHLNQSWSRHLLQIWGPIYHKIIQNSDQIHEENRLAKKYKKKFDTGDCEQKGKKRIE